MHESEMYLSLSVTRGLDTGAAVLTRKPRHSPSGHFHQLHTRVFPGQPRDVLGLPGGLLHDGACADHLPKETSRRHPNQLPKLPKLAPHPILSPTTHFSCFYLGPCSFLPLTGGREQR